MKARRDIDSTLDLGTTPIGLKRTEGLCNYQWSMQGPDGYVIFYCTNAEPCSGNPHHVHFGDDPANRATIEWATPDDVALRLEMARLKAVSA